MREVVLDGAHNHTSSTTARSPSAILQCERRRREKHPSGGDPASRIRFARHIRRAPALFPTCILRYTHTNVPNTPKTTSRASTLSGYRVISNLIFHLNSLLPAKLLLRGISLGRLRRELRRLRRGTTNAELGGCRRWRSPECRRTASRGCGSRSVAETRRLLRGGLLRRRGTEARRCPVTELVGGGGPPYLLLSGYHLHTKKRVVNASGCFTIAFLWVLNSCFRPRSPVL